MAVRVQFLADVVDWVKGLGDSKKSLTENEQGLEDLMEQAIELGRQVGKTSDEIASDFSHAFGVPLDRAKTAVDEVLNKTDDLGDSAQKTGRKVADGMDDAAKSSSKIKPGIDDVGGSLSQLGQIAQDVLSGDFQSAAQGGLDAIGGLAAGAGIGGAVGSALIAAISGLVGAAITEFDVFGEKAAKIRDDVSSALVDIGGAFTEADLESRMRDVVNDTQAWSEANTINKLTGLDLATIVRGLAGDTDALRETMDAYTPAMEKAFKDNQITQAMRDARSALEATNEGIENGTSKTSVLNRAIDQTKASTSAANEQYSEWRANLAAPLPTPHTKVTVDTSDILRAGSLIAQLQRTITVKTNIVGPLASGYVPGRQLLGG